MKGLASNRNNTLLVAFPNTADAANLGIQICNLQADEFGNAQTGGIKDFEHGAVAQTERRRGIGLLQKPLDLFEFQVARQRAPDLR